MLPTQDKEAKQQLIEELTRIKAKIFASAFDPYASRMDVLELYARAQSIEEALNSSDGVNRP